MIWMRRPLLATALVVANSCGGGSPASPTRIDAPRAVLLISGPYTLALTLSTSGISTCQNGFCTSTSLCIGNPTANTTLRFDVDLQRSGDEATIRMPGAGTGLALTLHVDPASVSGTISGSARDASGSSVEASGTMIGAAPSNTAIAVAGNIDGQMTVSGGSCSNNGHAWSLTRH
jgi:hypothetical protein